MSRHRVQVAPSTMELARTLERRGFDPSDVSLKAMARLGRQLQGQLGADDKGGTDSASSGGGFFSSLFHSVASVPSNLLSFAGKATNLYHAFGGSTGMDKSAAELNDYLAKIKQDGLQADSIIRSIVNPVWKKSKNPMAPAYVSQLTSSAAQVKNYGMAAAKNVQSALDAYAAYSRNLAAGQSPLQNMSVFEMRKKQADQVYQQSQSLFGQFMGQYNSANQALMQTTSVPGAVLRRLPTAVLDTVQRGAQVAGRFGQAAETAVESVAPLAKYVPWALGAGAALLLIMQLKPTVRYVSAPQGGQ